MTYKVGGDVFPTYDEAVEYCRKQRIVYFDTALLYLAEYGLQDSLKIAVKFGVDVDNVSLELLATLLYQQKLIGSIHEK